MLAFRLKRDDEDSDVYLDALSTDKKIWYRLPTESSKLDLHTELLRLKTFTNQVNACKRIRHGAVALSDNLKRVYMDDGENLKFADEALDEEESGTVTVAASTSETDIQSSKKVTTNQADEHLLKRIADLELRNLQLSQDKDQIRLKDVEKALTIEKFNGKQNTTEWLERFERECARNKITSSERLIEALRFYLSDSAADWYQAKYKQLKLKDWKPWKESLLEIYADKGWASVNRAYDFKFIGGLGLDFALRKDKLLLDADPEMTAKSRIGAIVYCLPKEIQKELDREKLQTVDQLCVELRRLDDPKINKKQPQKSDGHKNQQNDKQQSESGRSGGNNTKQRSDSNREPCFMCTFIGLTNPPRYHSPAKCENKQKFAAKLQSVNCVLEKDGNLSDSNEIAQIMNIQIEDKQ